MSARQTMLDIVKEFGPISAKDLMVHMVEAGVAEKEARKIFQSLLSWEEIGLNHDMGVDLMGRPGVTGLFY